jgi:hypothetical protein
MDLDQQAGEREERDKIKMMINEGEQTDWRYCVYH